MADLRTTSTVWLIGLGLLFCRPCLAAGAVATEAPWKLCVVMRVVQGQAQYVGTVSEADIRPALQTSVLPGRTLPTQRAGINLPYRLWLVGNGTSAAIAYSPALGKYSAAQGSSGTESSRAIASALAHVVQVARRPHGPPWPRLNGTAKVAIGTFPAPAPTLDLQVQDSVLLVTGTVAGILRIGHDPENTLFPSQHTVFVVAVDRTLRCPPGVTPPGVVKVSQPGGNLSWTDPAGGENGTGYLFKGAPLLPLGRQVLLFLRSPSGWPRSIGRTGFVSGENNGVSGLEGYLDEFIPIDTVQGFVLIDRQITSGPTEDGLVYHWEFEAGGPEIEGVPVATALSSVAAAAKGGTVSASGR